MGTIRIRFATEATELSAAARARLDEIAARLKARPGVRVQIVGYASESAEATGQARRRSLFRVISVRKYLVARGVLSTRMDVRALGDKTEVAPRDRVDVVIPPS
ncbi:MAG: OmpA family protein [Alphaproteobacteria bacterium]